MNAQFFIAFAGLLNAATCSAQFVQQRQIDYPLQGVVLGNGWSSLAAAKTPGGCVEFAEVQDLSEDRTLDLKRVVDKEQLHRELSVSAEFQAKSIGGIGASTKATYAKSLEVKNEALNLVIVAKVLQGARFAAPKAGLSGVQLTSSAEALARTNIQGFIALCGDSFVSAIHAGGEMNAFLSFDIVSREERESVSVSMSASGLSYSGSTTVNQTMRQYRESQKLRILMHSAGGTGIAIPVNEQELFERLRSLPSDAKTAPKPYRISVARYDQLPNWPPASNVNAVKFEEMDRLVGQYQRYSSLYYDTYSVLQRPDAYLFRGSLTLDSVRQLQDRLRLKLLPDLTKSIDRCMSEGACSPQASGDGLDYELRSLMPVARASFEEDARLAQLEEDRTATAQAYAAMPDKVKVDTPVVKLEIPNLAKVSMQRKLDNLDKTLATARAAHPAALASAMYKQWVETPSFYRCLANPVWDYCLSQEALAVYRSKIAVLVN